MTVRMEAWQAVAGLICVVAWWVAGVIGLIIMTTEAVKHAEQVKKADWLNQTCQHITHRRDAEWIIDKGTPSYGFFGCNMYEELSNVQAQEDAVYIKYGWN